MESSLTCPSFTSTSHHSPFRRQPGWPVLDLHWPVCLSPHQVTTHRIVKAAKASCMASSWTCWPSSRQKMLINSSTRTRLPDSSRALSNCTMLTTPASHMGRKYLQYRMWLDSNRCKVTGITNKSMEGSPEGICSGSTFTEESFWNDSFGTGIILLKRDLHKENCKHKENVHLRYYHKHSLTQKAIALPVHFCNWDNLSPLSQSGKPATLSIHNEMRLITRELKISF